jgi:hypothetical protein
MHCSCCPSSRRSVGYELLCRSLSPLSKRIGATSKFVTHTHATTQARTNIKTMPSETADRPRKRLATSSLVAFVDNYDEQPLRRVRRDVLACELETVQGELEHERILRGLDFKRFQQTKARLEKQVEFAMEEARESKALMEEMREENERHVDQLKKARTRVKEELRDVQAELEDFRAKTAAKDLNEDPRVDQLQGTVEARTIENKALKETIEELRDEMKRIMEREEFSIKEIASGPETSTPGAASEARPEILQELNKVRVALAESERKNRQYKRAAEDAQRIAKQLVQEKELARSATRRAAQLEAKLADSTQEGATLTEELNAWREFGLVLAKQLGGGRSSSSDTSVPPEISVLNKYWNDAKAKADEAEAEQTSLKRQLEQSRETIQKLEVQSRDFERKEAVWKQDYQNLEKRMELAQMDTKLLKRQENVYKREVESLRCIVKKFDELPFGTSQSSSTNSCSFPPANVRLLEAALAAAQEEMTVVKEGRDSAQRELDGALFEKAELQQTHNSVLVKFDKLKEALFAERAKVEKAEERANEAEVLSGKGSFNPEETRVLHLSNSPLTAALKDEIHVLRKRLEVLAGGEKNKVPVTDVDPNKLHQRLKQSFKEQIGRFREGVYLMTGFKVSKTSKLFLPLRLLLEQNLTIFVVSLKVDMIPENDRYKFKVRSVFAERESDHLMFHWPEGGEVSSLDLLDTELAKLLTTTPPYDYMTKFHSLPAFLASVQLSLFEKQTMI